MKRLIRLGNKYHRCDLLPSLDRLIANQPGGEHGPPNPSSKHGADINAHTKVTMPEGEYVAACPAAASGTGTIRQRALPTADGGMTRLPLRFRW